jgi:uncharacterized protein
MVRCHPGRVRGIVATMVMLVGMTIAAAPALAAPSWCSGQLSPTEAVICSDQELSALDARLNDVYKAALATVDPSEDVHGAQKSWIAFRNDCGYDKNCLREAYRGQIKLLEAKMRPQPSNGGGGTQCKVRNACGPVFCERIQTCCDNSGNCQNMNLGHFPNPN